VTAHALAGLAGLNALYLAAGATFLWLVRGISDWIDALRLLGLAYVAGAVVTGSTWTLLLIAGAPLSLGLVLGLPVALAAAFAVAGRARRRSLPRGGRLEGGRQLVVTAIGIAASGLLLEALFRPARLSGLYEFDGWSFWVPKAKAIYELGGLDEGFFTTLPGAAYPPLVPTLDAAAFHAMGSADVVTLHVQYWLFGVGLVWALAGLLAERVPAWILWPFVVLLLLAPRLGRRLQIAEADMFLDVVFVLASVLVLYWLLDRQRWRLVVATALLSGMVLTKREGLLLFAVLLVAALVTSARQWRSAWPALGVMTAVVAAAAIPWRIWYVTRDVGGEGPADGFVQGDRLDVLGQAIRRVFDVLFDVGYWNVVVIVAVGALVLAALARVGRTAVFLGTLLALLVIGGIWATWVFSLTGEGHVIGGNFVIRLLGSAALLCVAASPLLLSAVWAKVGETGETRAPRDARPRRLGLAAAIAVVPLLAYPVAAVAGGAPRFPTRDECAGPATTDGPDLEVVYGRFDDPRSADDLLAKLNAIGFIGADIEFDACARWKVSYEAIESLEQGEALAAQVREAGFDAQVEHGG
jgi:hypothetical protein